MNTTTEERNEIAYLSIQTFFKSAFSTLPFIGTILTDVLFEYRPKVKQNRLNYFIQTLQEALSKSNNNIDLENIKSEEFGDLLENVLQKVTIAKGEKKLNGFKKILLEGMKPAFNYDYYRIFLELLAQLQEKQIEILKVHSNILEKHTVSEKRDLKSQLLEVENKIRDEEFIDRGDEQRLFNQLLTSRNAIRQRIDVINQELKSNEHFRKSKHYNISEEEYFFYTQDLFNKGLLYDEGIGSIGTKPFEIMRITGLGKKFLTEILING